jgi:ACS family tartrate transporter-like MFS transporter
MNSAGAVERRILRKVCLRLLPLALMAYFFCFLDRANVGFAALTMVKDLDLNSKMFGFAAGSFFWGYFLFEVPSNLIMTRLGARLWIGRIMITWGILTAAMAFCTGLYSLLAVRILLGIAEAGLYPGLVLFFTYWLPDRHRGRILAAFQVAAPIAVMAGAPISTAFLGLNGLQGLAGWQWMFLGEAVPTILIGIAVLLYLTDHPAQARWLTGEERAWLTNTIADERSRIESRHKVGVLRSFWNPKVLMLSLNYLGMLTAGLGMLFFVPQIIKQIGLTNMQVGWATMIPYLCGGISAVVWGWISDRMGERRWNLVAGCVLAAAGLIIAGLSVGTWWSLVGISIASIGINGKQGPFWAMPPMFLTGAASAAAIAWINSIGNLGGSVGPFVIGWVKDSTGSFAWGLYCMAGFALVAAAVAALGLNIRPAIAAQQREGIASDDSESPPARAPLA